MLIQVNFFIHFREESDSDDSDIDLDISLDFMALGMNEKI